MEKRNEHFLRLRMMHFLRVYIYISMYTYVMLVYNQEMIEAKYTFDLLHDEHELFVFVLEHKYNEKLLDTYTTI